jgi:hypothetical protein
MPEVARVMASVRDKTLVYPGVARTLQRVEIPGAVEEERSEPVVTPVPAVRLFEVAPDNRVFPQRYADQERPAVYFAANATELGELIVGAGDIVVGSRFSEEAA